MSQRSCPDGSFERCLRYKLGKLEQELIQAHCRALQSVDIALLSSPIPCERHEVGAVERSECKDGHTLRPWLVKVQLPDFKTEENSRALEESQLQRSPTSEGTDVCNAASTLESYDQPDEGIPQTMAAFVREESSAHVSSKSPHTRSGITEDSPMQSCFNEPGGQTPKLPNRLDSLLRVNWQSPEIAISRARGKKRTRFTTKLQRTLEEINRNRHGNDNEHQIVRTRRKFTEWVKSSGCVIHPYSKFWIAWELLGLLLLVHDIVFVPMQVFEIPRTTTILALQWLTIGYWTMTFFFTFLVSYQTDSQAVLITDHSKIVLHYLKGWFILDIFLVCSDWMSVAFELLFDTSNSNFRTARMARMARMGRLLRSLRLLRMMRLGEFMQRISRFIDSEYLSICFLIATNLVAILCLAHVAACIWFGIASEESTSWLQPLDLTTASLFDQYILSLGWALSTLLGNSVTKAYPQTKVEYSIALVILLTGTIAVSLVFSSTTAAMTRLQQMQSAERDATFKLKSYLRQHRISSSLEARVLRYVDIARSVHSRRIASEDVRLLSLLSGPLRLELQLELHAPSMLLHPFFILYYSISPGAMSELCLKAVGWIFLSRYDVLFQTFSQASRMYFLEGGVMVYRRAKGAKNARSTVNLVKGSSFCEATLWTYWIHRGRMVALIESQVLALDVASFCDITESHHDVLMKAFEYAADYVRMMIERAETDGCFWDIASEMMYPDNYGDREAFMLDKTDPGYLKVLRNAEEISSELMDHESDSDSEDERVLQSALACNINQSSSRLSAKFSSSSGSSLLKFKKFDA